MTLILPKSSVSELPKNIHIKSCKDGSLEPAQIIRLTASLAQKGITGCWWNNIQLREGHTYPQDFHWDWVDLANRYGAFDVVECVAVRTNDGTIQGAMILTLDGESGNHPGLEVAEIERIATNPANRGDLVEKPGFTGVGTELFDWALFQSYLMGWEGRLNLYALEGAIGWYKSRGMRPTGALDPVEKLTQLEIDGDTSLDTLRNKGYVA